MDPVIDRVVENKCLHCKKAIVTGERRYFSRQAGMKGLYHWDCFIAACRRANEAGAVAIETIVETTGCNDNSYEIVHDD